MFKKKSKELILVFLCMALAIGSLGYLTNKVFAYAQAAFASDGFILTSKHDGTVNDTVNAQYYFNEGVKYLRKTDDTIRFKTINGDKVSVSNNNFVHFTDESMTALAKSVILDADSLYDGQVLYYTVPATSLVEKRNSGYAVNIGTDVLQLSNFIWKLSESKYMLVSDKITLVVDEGSTQSFDGFIQLEYIDDGVVHLVNQEGTYSTVSSAAYLELLDGVRIYIGSKNISDENGILMNLSQMLVNASDKTESNPDEAYKHETDVQPKITVEANDGEDGETGEVGEVGEKGEEGEQGEEGEKGEQGEEGKEGEQGQQGDTGGTGDGGKPGKPGNQGGPGTPGGPGEGGDPGEDAPDSDITYIEETAPEFYAVLTPSAYGVDAQISYEALDCTVNMDTATVSIIESATGKEVWKGAIKGSEKDGYYINCDILKQNTNYTFAITATYTPDATGKAVTQKVFTKYFTTSSLGLDLAVAYVGMESVHVTITKSEDNDITSLIVKCYDANGNPVYHTGSTDFVYGVPTDPDVHFADEAGGCRIYVDEMKVGNSIELLLDGLERNTTYYLKIDSVQVDESKNLSPEIVTVLTTSFPLVKAKTLKLAPSLGAPLVNISERLNSFIITPVDIYDPDKGIVSYTYEIYNAEYVAVDTDTGEIKYNSLPVFSSESSTPVELAVDIDGTNLRREADYIARIVAKFDNNETVISYPSPLSPTFRAGQSVWPIITNQLRPEFLTASTAQGTLIIDDPFKTIKRDAYGSFGVTISWKSAELIDGKNIGGSIVISEEIMQAGEANGRYEIPYFITGLKEDCRYNLYVAAGSLIANGQVYTDIIVGADGFKTNKYEPLKMTMTEVSTDEHSFCFKVSLLAGDKEKEQHNVDIFTNNVNDIAGDEHNLTNMGDFSGKALQALRFDLYSTGGDDLGSYMGSYYIVDDNYRKKTDGVYTGVYKFGTSDTSLYKKYYRSDVIAGTLASHDASELMLTEQSFNLTPQEIMHSVAIKITAYDYCYGIGSKETMLFGANNVIPVYDDTEDSVEIKVHTENDQYKYSYLIIETHDTLPDPEDLILEIDPLLKKNAKADTYSGANAAYTTRSNAGATDFKLLWKDVYDGTQVGAVVHGYSTLAKYGKSISYTVYDKEDNVVAESGWINLFNNLECPDWTFFFDVKGTSGSAVSRGDYFTVETHMQLNSEYDGKTYPDDFSFSGRKKKLLGTAASPKQIPEIYLAEKDCIKDSQGKAKISSYFDYIDIDSALVKGDPSVQNVTGVKFFVAPDPNNIPTQPAIDFDVINNTKLVNELYYYADSGIYTDNPRFILGNSTKLILNEDQMLYALYNRYSNDYYLTKYNDDTVAAEAAQAKANAPLCVVDDTENIIPQKSKYFYIVGQPGVPEKIQTGIFNEYFQDWPVARVEEASSKLVLKFAVLVQDISAFGKLDLTFHKEQKDVTFEDVEYSCSGKPGQPYGSYTVDGISYNAYVIEADINASQLIDFAGSTEFTCYIKFYYDDGYYGLDYIELGNDYLLQYGNQRRYYNENGGDTEPRYIISAETTGLTTGYSDAVKFTKVKSTTAETRYVSLSGYPETNIMRSASSSQGAGLDLIPRKLNVLQASSNITLAYMLPSIMGEIYPGITTARVDYVVSKENTLSDPGSGNSNVRFIYGTEKGPDGHLKSGSSKYEVYVPPGQDVQGSFILTELFSNKEYFVEIQTLMPTGEWIYLNKTNGDPTSEKTNIKEFHTFKALNLDIQDGSVEFKAFKDARNDKQLSYKTKIDDVPLTDIVTGGCIDYVEVDVLDENGASVVTEHVYSRAQLYDMYISNSANSDAEGYKTYGDINLEDVFMWDPDLSGIHMMNGNQKYEMRVTAHYQFGVENNFDSLIKTPNTWSKTESMQSLSYSLARLPEEPGYVKLSLKFSARDLNRVFKVETNGKLKVEISIRKADGTSTGLENEDISFEVNYNDSNGNVTSSDKTNSPQWNVPLNSIFVVYSTIYADYDNDGEYEPYTISPGRISTPSIEDLTLGHVGLEPQNTMALLSGTNLSFVRSLRYTLYENGVQVEQKSINYTNIQSYFKPITETYYMLWLDRMNDTGKTYSLDVEIFDGESWNGNSYQSTGVYPEERVFKDL